MSLSDRLQLTPKELIIDCTVLKLESINNTCAMFYIGNVERPKNLPRVVALLVADSDIPESVRRTFAANLEANEATRAAIDYETM